VRHRLFALVAFVALPFATYLGMELRAALQQAEDQLRATNEAAAAQIAARLDDRLSDVDNVLRALSHTVVPDERSVEENDRRLQALRPDLPPFLSNVVLWDRWGVAVGAVDPAIRAVPFRVSDRRYFQDSLNSARMAIEAPLVSRANGERMGVIARPVLVDMRAVGVIAASVPLDHLAEIIAEHRGLPPDSRIEVRNAAGELLASAGAGVGDAEVTEAATGESIAADAMTSFGGWTVTISTRVAAATAPIHAQLRRHVVVGIIVLLGSLALAAAVASQIGRGLQRLAADAELIGKGVPGHRTPIRGSDEIGVLGMTLNRMADDLAARESALQRSDTRFRAIADNVPALIAYLSSDERYEFMNDYGAKLIGREQSEIVGRTIREVRGEHAYKQIEGPLRQALHQGFPVTFEHAYVRHANVRDVALTYLPDYDDALGVRGVFVLGVDLTEARRAELTIRERETMLRSIADHLPVLIAVVDRELRYTYCNATYREWTGNDPAGLVGRQVVDVIGHEGFFEDLPYMDRALSGQAVTFERPGEVGGKRRYLQKTYIPRLSMERAGEVTGFYSLVQDLTARRELEQSLEQMAQCDQLTGLPNRYLLHDRLAQACHRSVRDDTQLALFFLDLDNFKPINDNLGHACGDIVLKTIAERLRDAVRMSDTVCRYGGDEFVLLLEGFTSYRQLETMARKLIALVEQPIVLGDAQTSCSTSVGVATYPPSKSWEMLLETADSAMYEAKAAGPGGFSIAPLKAAGHHGTAVTTR